MLKEIRNMLNLTRKEFGELTGLSERTIYNVEVGKSKNKNALKAYKKGLLNIYGFRQKDIARMSGMSEATVSRWVNGTSRNAKVTASMENLFKNYKYAAEFNQLRTKVINKVHMLEQHGAYGPAYNKLMSDGGVPLKDVLSEDKSVIMREIGRLRQFDAYKTSTVTGYEDWSTNVDMASRATSGYDKWSENDKFWRVYNELRHDRTTNIFWNGDRYDSDFVAECITRVMESVRNINGSMSVGEIVQEVKQMAEDQYRKDREWKTRLREQRHKWRTGR